MNSIIKNIIAIVAIFLVLELIPVTVGIIMGRTLLEILPVCGMLLLAILVSIPFSIAIYCIIKWAID